ncbi:hypothetical protein P3S68_014255 [Capsicum galapagoense]
MDNDDRSWINYHRWSDKFERGVKYFLDKAFERASKGNEILCPCAKCMNRYWHYRNVEGKQQLYPDMTANECMKNDNHNAHIVLHYLLQIAVRNVLPKNVSLPLIMLGNFFRAICSKVIRRSDLEKFESEIVELNCELENFFHPTYFDIMTHLPIHLVNEIKLGGPTHCRSMYPIERKLSKLKTFVRNRSCLEASIAEGFLEEEYLTFCSRYLHDGVKTRFSRYETEDQAKDDVCVQNMSPIFPKIGHPIGREKKKDSTFLLDSKLCYEEYRYVLFNTGDEQVEKFIEGT